MDGPGSHPEDTTTTTTTAPTAKTAALKPALSPAAALDGARRTTRADVNTSLQPLAQANAAASYAHSNVPSAADTTSLPVPRYHIRAPSNALKLDTDFASSPIHTPINTAIESGTLAHHGNESRRPSASAPIAIQEGYLRSAWSTASIGSLSPASAFSSPALNALGDLTPLPSPLVMNDSPGPWQRAVPRPRSRGASNASRDDSVLTFSKGMLSPSPSVKKKGFSSLKNAAVEAAAAHNQHKHGVSHGRNRSSSEFLPEALHNARSMASATADSRSVNPGQGSMQCGQRSSSSSFVPQYSDSHRKDPFAAVEQNNSAISPRDVLRNPPLNPRQTPPHNHSDMTTPNDPQLHREQYLAQQRGLVSAKMPAGLPTPPASNASNRSITDTEEEDITDDDKTQYLVMRHGPQKTKTLWRPVRQLGYGTFSKVYLATCEKTKAKDPLDENALDPRKLVAIKVVEHGPAGGADEERVELSLKREVEMLRSVSHPSLVHLQAFDHDDAQALIALTYCSGGDLFDVAKDHANQLTPAIVQRIFAELVSAVLYLHKELIVHRDIKLESIALFSFICLNHDVLLNMHISSVAAIKEPRSHPHAIATLTDLGLSRRIPAPPESPLLTTRCGSEDYAAPEILLGQPYDGRATDAWALGVVLYSLMEGRMPFDPPPGKAASRSRAAHRIARCDWEWVKFANEDGEWDADKGREWTGARECVEGLLKKVSRGRKSLDDIAKMEWVQQGIQVERGLQKRPEDEVTRQHTEDALLR